MTPRRPDNPPLRRAELDDDPFEQFALWYERAVDEVPLADARMVLLKGFGPAGFRFFSNYESAKARQLEATGRAAIVVYWRELDRQVRARGTVHRLADEDSDAYFATRPRGAQLGAWASPQSRAIEDRAELERRLAESGTRFDHADVPRPPHWGGWVLDPELVEFWQGRADRLHDRFVYSRSSGDDWIIKRLAP